MSDVRLVTAVPSLGLSPRLEDVLRVAAGESDAIRVYDNTPAGAKSQVSEIPLDKAAAEYISMPGSTLYAEWNAAAEWAADQGAFLALLNDDIHLMPGMLTQLIEGAVADKELGLLSFDWDPTPSPLCVVPAHGTYQHGGISGWGFVVRPGAWPGINPEYRVWYGDDQMVTRMLAKGWRVGRYRGLFVEHDTSTTINQLPWVNDAIVADTQRWRQEHS